MVETQGISAIFQADFKVLGDIGNRRQYKCNRCGLEWHRKIIVQIEANNKANEDYLRGLPRKW